MTSGPDDLYAFLEACIAEEEAGAHLALATQVRDPDGTIRNINRWHDAQWVEIDYEQMQHVERWHPTRVLAQCAARRAVLEEARETARAYRENPTPFGEGRRFAAAVACGLLATAYADRPGYNEDWRP